MEKENASLNFRLNEIDETRNCFLEKAKHIKLISQKDENTFKTLNYAETLSFYFSQLWFNFCFCFYCCYACGNYKFCTWIKNLCNNCLDKSTTKKKRLKIII